MTVFKIITIVGARPQFIKAAALSRALRRYDPGKVREIIVHTGQHYDDNMSDVFFRELEIPKPAYNLEIGSGSHGYQAGEMIPGIEKILENETPDLVIVYGDTNTTLAGALAASKMHIPVAHIEAGLRSFNKSMPEEINRVLTDHVSTFLFSPTETGISNLLREGFDTAALPPFSADHPAVYHCGDVMYDNAMYFADIAEQTSSILKNNNIENDEFILCTLHRDNNTDNPGRLNDILSTLLDLGREYKIKMIMPLHPRTSKMMGSLLSEKNKEDIKSGEYLRITGPVGYFDTLVLEKRCRMVITDSGGVQKEAFFFKKPCIVLRPETEWKELPAAGASEVVDADPERIRAAFAKFYSTPPQHYPPLFGDGNSAEFIIDELVKFLPRGLVV